MTKKSKAPPLSFAAYQRLHNVIHSLAMNFAHGTERSCVFFSITGAALMHKHYKLNAKVVCGGGAVMLSNEPETGLSWFVNRPDGTLETGIEGFHAWIECDGWLIDLTAPNYHEALASGSFQGTAAEQRPAAIKVPRMMMQKPLDEIGGDLENVRKPGECAFFPDLDVTTEVIDEAFDRVQLGDVINIAYNWHRPIPQKMAASITIGDNYGEVKTINLVRRELVGKW